MRSIIIFVFILLILSACGGFAPDQTTLRPRPTCAEPRLNSSFQFHSKAKEFLGSYYKTRKENELFYAWYASEDSIYMAKTIRRCFDKRNKHFHAVKNVISKNQTLQRLIVQNMRVGSQTRLSELFLDDYRKIFVRDIQ